MTLSFVFTWTPYAFMSTVAASGVTINSPVVLLPTLFAKSSCAYNPFVFFFSHSAFKSYHFGFSSCIKTPETQEHPGVYVSNVRFQNRVGPSGATHATSRAGIRSSTEAIPNGDHSKVIQISVHPVQQSNVLWCLLKSASGDGQLLKRRLWHNDERHTVLDVSVSFGAPCWASNVQCG